MNYIKFNKRVPKSGIVEERKPFMTSRQYVIIGGLVALICAILMALLDKWF